MRKHDWLTALLCLLLVFFAASTISPDEVGLGHDDGIYVILGKALSQGNGLRLINLPTSPYQAKYPIVYPFLISLAWSLVDFPDNIFWIKLMNVVFLFLILLVTYDISLILLDASRFLARLVILLVGTSFYVLHFSTNAFPEIPYLFFSLAAVLLLLQGEGRKVTDNDNDKKYGSSFLAILCVSLAFQTRLAGLTLLLASVLYFLLRIKEKKKTAISVLLLLFALNLPWLFWTKAHNASPNINPLLDYYTGYTSSAIGLNSFFDLTILKTTILAKIPYLYMNTAILISNSSRVLKPLMAIVWVILLLGIYKSLWDKRYLFIHLYLAAYVSMYLCWPSLPASWLRHLIPMLPFLYILFFRGILVIKGELSRFGNWRPQFYFSALVILTLLPNLPAGIIGIRKNIQQGRQVWDGYKEVISWIKEHSDKDAILASAYDPVYYLYTDRLSLRPWFQNAPTYYSPSLEEARPFLGDPDHCYSLLRDLNVGYLIREPLGGAEKKPVGKFFSDMVQRHSDELKLVFVSKDKLHKIYRIQYAKGRKSSTTRDIRPSE
jgi:hypothetical protein